jgi:hypothetical protein
MSVYSDTVPQNRTRECLPSCFIQPNVLAAYRRIDVATNVSFHAIDASLKEKVIMLQAGLSPI